MALNLKYKLNSQPAEPDAIQYLTENGFRIIHRCDVDDSFPKDGIEHCFIVRDPDGYELDITVTFDTQAAAELIQRNRRRITFESSFWMTAAERHLGDYLWEHNDFPPDALLRIDKPNPFDIDSALRWSVDGNL